jgi:hypothetical protein
LRIAQPGAGLEVALPQPGLRRPRVALSRNPGYGLRVVDALDHPRLAQRLAAMTPRDVDALIARRSQPTTTSLI